MGESDESAGLDELDKLENDDKLGKSYEVPRQFTIIDEPFSIENGLNLMIMKKQNPAMTKLRKKWQVL